MEAKRRLRSPARTRGRARLAAVFVRALLAPLLLAPLLLVSCQGELGSLPQGPSASDGARDGKDMVRAEPDDDAIRDENPALYDAARRYFPGEREHAGARRLVRLTRTQLDRTVRALLPGLSAATFVETLPRDPLQTHYEYAENLGFHAANFTPFTRVVDALAKSAAERPSTIVDCATSAPESCREQAARRFVTRAFRGVVSDPELNRFLSLFRSRTAESGLGEAVGDLLSVTLSSPHFVFRDEVRTKQGALHGAQLLQTISYNLADAPPEALGLALDTPLESQAQIEGVVQRVLMSDAAREKLLRFFLAWLEVKEPEEFTIANEVFPDFTPEVARAMVDDTRAFLERQLARDTPRLYDVTQSNEAFVSKALAPLYGVRVEGSGSVVKLDVRERLGIFTHPAVITSHSGPTTTRLVKRGVFFTRKVMCLPLGLPPAGLDTTLEETASETERQRVERATVNTPCKGCHTYINPFGFMQESFDAIGRVRTEDEGLPIDASVDLSFLQEGRIVTTSAVDALRALTRTLRFQQCFARQLFRFYMGRDEQDGDHPTLRRMFFGLASDDQDIVATLRRLALSKSFLERAEGP
jgi:hypothetical protein